MPRIPADVQLLRVLARAVPAPGDGLEPAVAHEADPGHRGMTRVHADAADLLVQRLRLGHAHDGLVGVRDGLVERAHALRARLRTSRLVAPSHEAHHQQHDAEADGRGPRVVAHVERIDAAHGRDQHVQRPEGRAHREEAMARARLAPRGAHAQHEKADARVDHGQDRRAARQRHAQRDGGAHRDHGRRERGDDPCAMARGHADVVHEPEAVAAMDREVDQQVDGIGRGRPRQERVVECGEHHVEREGRGEPQHAGLAVAHPHEGLHEGHDAERERDDVGAGEWLDRVVGMHEGIGQQPECRCMLTHDPV